MLSRRRKLCVAARLAFKIYQLTLLFCAFQFRLDNVVARFHLDYHDQPLLGNTKFTRQFPRNAEGFRKWCAQDDKTKFFFESRYTDDKMRHLMMKIPCMNEFYR